MEIKDLGRITGKSAYEIAVEKTGFVGTEKQWIRSIVGVEGKKGKDGVDGVNGKDGLDGVNGKDGNDGIDGENGVDGEDGKDAINGYVKPETGIPKTDLASDVFDGLGSGWEKIEDRLLTANVSTTEQIKFVGLSKYRFIKVLYSVKSATNSSDTMLLRINGVSTSIYSQVDITGVTLANRVSQSAFLMFGILSSGTYPFSYGEVNLLNELGKTKTIMGKTICPNVSATGVPSVIRNHGAFYDGIQTTIESLGFMGQNQPIVSGSRFTVFGMK